MVTQQIDTSSLDTHLKEKATELFKQYGMSLNEALTIFLKKSINDQRIPFDIQEPNDETLKAMKDIETGENYEDITLEDLKRELKTA